MKRRSTATLIFILALGGAVLPCSQLRAQQKCAEVRGILQGILPSPNNPVGDLGGLPAIWGGAVYAVIGGEVYKGVFVGNDGDPSQRGAKGGHYEWAFYDDSHLLIGTIAYEVPNSVFGFPPGKSGMGVYLGNDAKIVGGTGKFAGVTGHLNVSGPYVLWPSSSSPFGVYGRFNGQFSGTVCDIK